MKQIITKYSNRNLSNKYYENHLGQRNGTCINYYPNGSIWWKTNYINDKRFGLYTDYNTNGKLIEIIYHL